MDPEGVDEWVPDADHLEQLMDAMGGCMLPDPAARQKSEEVLRSMEQLPDFVLYVAHVVHGDGATFDRMLCQLSAILLRRWMRNNSIKVAEAESDESALHGILPLIGDAMRDLLSMAHAPAVMRGPLSHPLLQTVHFFAAHVTDRDELQHMHRHVASLVPSEDSALGADEHTRT